MNKLILDIGGTFVKYCLITGRKRKYGSFPVINNKNKEDVPNAIKKFIKNINVDQIGISAPAPFDYTNGISLMTHKLKSLYKVDLMKLFKSKFPNAEVIFIHDAVAFILGTIYEYPELKNKNISCVMLGTGLGYAYASKGRVSVFENETSKPEFGFQKYKDGIIEDIVSATGLINLAKKKGYKYRYVAEMAKDAKKDKKLKEIFYFVGKTLGEVLNKQNKIDPFTTLIIGGGVSKSWNLIKPGFTSVSKIKYIVIKDSTLTPIDGVIYALNKNKKNIYL